VVREPGFGGWRGVLSTLAVGLFVAATWSPFQASLAAGFSMAALLSVAGYLCACLLIGATTAVLLGWAQNRLRR
jgi:hypothetical protein